MRAIKLCPFAVAYSRAISVHTSGRLAGFLRPNAVTAAEELLEMGEASGASSLKRSAWRQRQLTLSVPLPLQRALLRVLAETVDVAQLVADAQTLRNVLDARRLPWSKVEFRLRSEELKEQFGLDVAEDEDADLSSRDKRKLTKVKKKLSQEMYNWQPIAFQSLEKCLSYCIARTAQDYAVTGRVLEELRMLAGPEWRPEHLLDFGSGVGSSFWAANSLWGDAIQEHVLVDPSMFMNQLAQLLLQGGDANAEPIHPAVFFRQLLPAESRRFRLVISSFSLMNFPSLKERLQMVESLWNSTEEYLVLIERGSKDGYRVILEARDHLLACSNEVDRNELWARVGEVGGDLEQLQELLEKRGVPESDRFHLIQQQFPDVSVPTLLDPGQVVAPCPHDMTCPRPTMAPGTRCNFSIRYVPLSLNDNLNPASAEEFFSYIILKKGRRQLDQVPWPRIIDNVLTRHKHVICRLCTANGVLEEVIVTKKYGKPMYRCAQTSVWGDRLPATTAFVAVSDPDRRSAVNS